MSVSALPGVTWRLEADGGDESREAVALCQGRCLDHYQRRIRPCPLRRVERVRGTHGLTADLCVRHARMATDLPRLVRDWLLQEERDRGPEGRSADEPPPAADRDRPLASADVVLRLAADLASLAVVRASLARALRRQGWADELHPVVLVAVGEAVANAIQHGSTPGSEVAVALSVDREGAVVRVSDGGRLGASLPLTLPVPPARHAVRGRGRRVMWELAERVEVSSDGRGTQVLLEFTRQSTRSRAPTTA